MKRPFFFALAAALLVVGLLCPPALHAQGCNGGQAGSYGYPGGYSNGNGYGGYSVPNGNGYGAGVQFAESDDLIPLCFRRARQRDFSFDLQFQQRSPYYYPTFAPQQFSPFDFELQLRIQEFERRRRFGGGGYSVPFQGGYGGPIAYGNGGGRGY